MIVQQKIEPNILEEQIFDDVEVGGLKGPEKLLLIIKIQSVYRANQARKQVKQQYGFVTTIQPIKKMEENYNNEQVQAKIQQMGEINLEQEEKIILA